MRQRNTTNPWVILVLICLAQFMVVLDATIVNVALPSIQKDLGLSEANLQWIVNAYTLVFGGFLLLGGRAGDLLGRKRLFLIGLVIFTSASLLNGLASTSGQLIGFRALQGLGAALISPAALSIISTTFSEGKERARALGGWLTQSFSWPWIFFVNVPVGIFTFFATLRLVPESKDEHAHQGYDIAGAVTVTGGLMTLVYAIVKAETKGWGSTTTIGLFLVALYLQRVLGYHPLKAGLAVLPFTGGIMVSAGLASNFAPRIGVRPVAAVGMVLTAVGMLLFARMPVGGSYVPDVLPGMIVASLGLGAVFMPLTL